VTEVGPAWATFATRSHLAVAAAGQGTDSATRFACATAVRAAKAGGTAGSALWVTESLGRSLAAAADAHRESAAEGTAGRVAGPGTGHSWASGSARPERWAEAASQQCRRAGASVGQQSLVGRSGC
jgi:hypothetical protein